MKRYYPNKESNLRKRRDLKRQGWTNIKISHGKVIAKRNDSEYSLTKIGNSAYVRILNEVVTVEEKGNR